MTTTQQGTGEQSPTLRLAFDLPTSVNKMYRRTRYSVVLTNEAKAWKDYAIVMAIRQWGGNPLTGELAVSYYFYGSKLDFDNPLKLLNDSLNGVVWKDDKQIVEAHIYVDRKDKLDPRVELEVWAI